MPEPEPVLRLDPSMMIPEPRPSVPAAMAGPAAAPALSPQGRSAPEGLVAPEAAAAAAQSVGSLVRTLTAERSVQIHSGGPTIEDIVREEIRPVLKQWLDVHLPPLVERLVRAEIERVVGRATP